MFVSKKLLAVLSVVILAGCSITQPKAPLVNGLTESSTKTKAPKQIAKPKYKTIKETVYVDKKVYHKVKKGEYVYSIARKYKVSPDKIIKQNKLKKPYTLRAGKSFTLKQIKLKK